MNVGTLNETEDRILIATALRVASQLEPGHEPDDTARRVIVELCKRVGLVTRETPTTTANASRPWLFFIMGAAFGALFIYLARFAV